MQSEINWIKTALDGKVKPANDLDSDHIKSLVYESSLKPHLLLLCNDSRELEYFKYRLDDPVVKDRRAQNTVAYLQEQLLSVRSDIKEERQC